MTTSTIKATLDGATTLFTSNPEHARQGQSVQGELVGTTAVRVEVAGHTVVFDEAPYLGGNDGGPNPVAMALATLGACEAIMYRFHAERMGIRFDELRFEVEGEVDLRGGLGFEGVDAGFQSVRCTVRLGGPESPECYEALHATVAATCPVLDSLRRAVAVETALEVAAPTP